MLFIVVCSVSGDLMTHALTVWILVPALWFDWKKFYFLDLLIGRRDTTVPVAFGGSTSRMYPRIGTYCRDVQRTGRYLHLERDVGSTATHQPIYLQVRY